MGVMFTNLANYGAPPCRDNIRDKQLIQNQPLPDSKPQGFPVILWRISNGTSDSETSSGRPRYSPNGSTCRASEVNNKILDHCGPVPVGFGKTKTLNRGYLFP